MFLETKKEGEARTDVPSLEGFIAWLEKQPVGAEYDYNNQEHCACAMYACSIGATKSWVDRIKSVPDLTGIWWQLDRLALGTNTFGTLLYRARMALPKAL